MCVVERPCCMGRAVASMHVGVVGSCKKPIGGSFPNCNQEPAASAAVWFQGVSQARWHVLTVARLARPCSIKQSSGLLSCLCGLPTYLSEERGCSVPIKLDLAPAA